MGTLRQDCKAQIPMEALRSYLTRVDWIKQPYAILRTAWPSGVAPGPFKGPPGPLYEPEPAPFKGPHPKHDIVQTRALLAGILCHSDPWFNDLVLFRYAMPALWASVL